MRELGHQKNLYDQLVRSDSFKKETSALKSLFKDSIWWLSEESDKMLISGIDKPAPLFCVKNASTRAACARRFRLLVNKARETKKPVRFDCGTSGKGICIPIVEGDKVVSRGTLRGTHRGEFQGIPPTGKRIEVTWISIDRIADGKIAEHRVEQDNLGMLQQLGVIPGPQG